MSDNALLDTLDRLKAEKVAKDAAAAIDRAQMRASLDTSAARAFLAQLALRLEIKPDWSIPTASVDGKTIRYNPPFIASLKDDGVHFVIIGHEPSHPALLHPVRGRHMECNECRQMAADGENNEFCQQAGFALLPCALLPGKGPLWMCKPGQTFEEMYGLLHEQHQKQGGGGGDQSSEGQEGQDPGGCGSFEPAADDAQAEQMEAEWRGRIAAAAQDVGRRIAEGKLKGDLPGDMQRWIDAVLHPKPHWREHLRDFVTQSLRKRNDNDWSRRSRRGIAAGIYLPSRRGEELGHGVIHVDCSGSTDEWMEEFAANVNGILACEPCHITVLYGDTELHGEPVEWEPCDGDFKLEQRGGGGTCHHHLARWIEEYSGDDEIAFVIALTDGFTTWPRDYGVQTLWAITPDGSTDAPFGRVVKIEADKS